MHLGLFIVLLLYGGVAVKVKDRSIIYIIGIYNSPGVIFNALYDMSTAVSNFVYSTGKV